MQRLSFVLQQLYSFEGLGLLKGGAPVGVQCAYALLAAAPAWAPGDVHVKECAGRGSTASRLYPDYLKEGETGRGSDEEGAEYTLVKMRYG